MNEVLDEAVEDFYSDNKKTIIQELRDRNKVKGSDSEIEEEYPDELREIAEEFYIEDIDILNTDEALE